MTSSEQAVFPARFTALRGTAAFARAFCERNGIDRNDALRLTLVIEELFTNSIEHGHRAECDAPIRVELAMQEGAVTLFYEDSAPRFDPLAEASASPTPIHPSADGPIGGLGVHLVRELASSARYAYEDGCNRLWLTLKPRPG